MTKPYTMSEQKREALNQFNAEQSDWYATCRKCKAKLSGTIAQIKEHKCGE